MVYRCFADAIKDTQDDFRHRSDIVPATQWQSTDISNWGERGYMREVLNASFQVALVDDVSVSLDNWREDIEPNLPWADTAFEERVNGTPWNPGTAWESWPYSRSAANFKQERFSHSYAERYWPKSASNLNDDAAWKRNVRQRVDNSGIRFDYGDLNDVVKLLEKDPLTRQAYLPMWFPEDTGVVHGERVPCSLGYHFIRRGNYFHCTYYIRSCDFIRHFRDDLYMTLRLQLWILDQLDWLEVKPGYFTFHCTSLHMFQNDWDKLFGQEAS